MRNKLFGVLLIVAVFFLLISASSVMGHGPGDALKNSTLKKVLDRKILRVGILGDFPKWSYLDDKNNYIGYDPSIAKLMADALGVKLELVETGTAGRIPFLLTGKIDIIIAGFGYSPERAKSVAYSKPYAGEVLLLVAPKNVNIKSPKDTAGKKVAVARGTTSDRVFTKKAAPGTKILRFEEVIDCFLALEQGKVDAVANGGLGYDTEQVKKHPQWEIKGPYGAEYARLGLKLGDQVWINWVNLFINHLGKKYILSDNHQEWFGVPLPEFVYPEHY